MDTATPIRNQLAIIHRHNKLEHPHLVEMPVLPIAES